jgi:hypothetical protein
VAPPLHKHYLYIQLNLSNILETRISCLFIKSTFSLEIIYSIITYYVSDLIDRRVDFDQWEFCIVWATSISFLNVLSAVPPFLSHARKSKPAERRDRSQSNVSIVIVNLIYSLFLGEYVLKRDHVSLF